MEAFLKSRILYLDFRLVKEKNNKHLDLPSQSVSCPFYLTFRPR